MWTSFHVKVEGNEKTEDFDSLQRVLLTTSGNLQRVVSAFYDRPVSVQIQRNKTLDTALVDDDFTTKKTYIRNVILSLSPRTIDDKISSIDENIKFGFAMSHVVITYTPYIRFFEDSQPGLGQFFHHFCVYPSFRLLKVGKGLPFSTPIFHSLATACNNPDIKLRESCNEWLWNDAINVELADEYEDIIKQWKDGSFWRLYVLEAPGISCKILEILRNDIFEMSLNTSGE